MKGEVVGITTAKFSGNSSTGASIEGIGFAIPMDDVTGMIQDLQTHGYVTGAYLGVMVRDVDANAQYYGLPAGAFVESTTAGGAADKGGIKGQDIITEIGSYKVTSVSDLTRVLRKFEAGQTVTVKVYRSGQMVDCMVTLDEKPREEKPAEQATTEPQTQPQMPGGDSFQDWFDFFQDYFG
jgi:serine protease Do